jgi:arylsulfatase A-like enzyme
VRIPAIFHAPGRAPARDGSGTLFSLVDLAPTLLGCVEAETPAWMQGCDFSPLLRGEPGFDPPVDVLLEMVGSPRWKLDFPDWRGLVTERYKYACYEDGRELLFDRDADA